MVTESLGDFCRQRRVETGISLRSAAKKLAISPAYLSKIELDQVPAPSGTLLRRLSKLCRAPIEEFEARATNRRDELMAADPASILAREFYMLTRGRPADELERALRVFVESLNFTTEQRERIRLGLPDLFEKIRRAEEDEALRLADMGLRRPGAGQLEFTFDASEIAPPNLTTGDIRDSAESHLARLLGTDVATCVLPVLIEELLERDTSIRLTVADDLSASPGGDSAVEGVARWSSDGRLKDLVIRSDIFTASGECERRRLRFTLAHEYGHAVLHLPLVRRDPQWRNRTFHSSATAGCRRRAGLSTNEQWLEWQADEFAANLLMPEIHITSAFRAWFDRPVDVADREAAYKLAARNQALPWAGRAQSICALFDVTPEDAGHRLISLGLLRVRRRATS